MFKFRVGEEVTISERFYRIWGTPVPVRRNFKVLAIYIEWGVEWFYLSDRSGGCYEENDLEKRNVQLHER